MSHCIGAPERFDGPMAFAGQHATSGLRHAKSASDSRIDLIGDGVQIAVDASEEINQNFLLVLSQAGKQPALPLQRRDDNGVMGLPSLRRQRDRVTAAVERAGLDRDQTPFLHQSEGAAHRTLIEADDVTNARGGDARLDREQRHDPPLRDVDAEALLVKRRGAARQLIGDERDERGHVTLEIERLACLGAVGSRRLSGGIGRSITAHVSHHPLKHALEK